MQVSGGSIDDKVALQPCPPGEGDCTVETQAKCRLEAG